MIPFRTTPDQVLKLAAIVLEMEKSGVDRNFIVDADELARKDQGVVDLMALWADAANDQAERDEIIADIHESIDDYRDAPPAAYKDVDAVMAAQSDLVEVVHTLKQVLCVKG
jgi:hypothetical protein